jgi:hypothetical protein
MTCCGAHPSARRGARRSDSPPQISDAELVTLAVMQALLGFTSESRWLRFATAHLHHLFPYLPQQSGYNKRLRNLAATISWLIGMLARDTTLWTDDVWVIDSTPVQVRPLTGGHPPQRVGRMGRIRLLRQPLPLLLGTTPTHARHPARPTCGLRTHGSQSR